MADEILFVGARLVTSVDHEFQPDEIAYIEQNGVTLAEIRDAIGEVPAESIAAGRTLDVLIGECKQDQAVGTEANEPNVIDPTDPKNEGSVPLETAPTQAT